MKGILEVGWGIRPGGLGLKRQGSWRSGSGHFRHTLAQVMGHEWE